jgi:hypothetical protein
VFSCWVPSPLPPFLSRCAPPSAAGSSKAITILSNPKYPAAEVARLATYTCLLDGQLKLPNLNEPLDGTLAPVGAALNTKALLTPDDEVLTRPLKQAAVLELLSRVSLKGLGGVVSARPPEPGLGILPSFLPAVSSALLFNSRENPYKEYRSLSDLITDEDQETAVAVLRRQAMNVMVRVRACVRARVGTAGVAMGAMVCACAREWVVSAGLEVVPRQAGPPAHAVESYIGKLR